MWSESFTAEKNLKGMLRNNERSSLMPCRTCGDAAVDTEHIAFLVT